LNKFSFVSKRVRFHFVWVERRQFRKKRKWRQRSLCRKTKEGAGRKTNTRIFEHLLGQVEACFFSRIEPQELEVHIHVDFTKGAKFPFKETFCPVHDTNIRPWRQMNLFQYRTYIHARVHRIQTPDGIQQVVVPWAREGCSPSKSCAWTKWPEAKDTGT